MRITPDAAKGLAIAYGSYLEALLYRKNEDAVRYWGKQLALYQQRTGVVMLKLDAEYMHSGFAELRQAADVAERQDDPLPYSAALRKAEVRQAARAPEVAF